MAFTLRLSVSMITVVTLAMYLVCISTDYWQATKTLKSINQHSAIQGTHSGIWNSCYVRDKQELCGHIHLESHWLRSVRAFLILGMIANLVATVLVILALIKDEICFRIIGFVLLANAIFIMIGLSVYAAESGVPFTRPLEEGCFAWSFIVCWCTWALTVIACIISFLEECYGEDPECHE